MNIPELIKSMTLEEKAGLCSGLDCWHLKSVPRLGIPSIMVSDGPHGLRKQDDSADNLGINDSIQAVCFPAGCATACSFDEELMTKMGSALGEECRAEKVSVLLGPAVNLKRSPLCGRNFEYFSEDPYLAGKLAAAQIRGIQSWDVGVSVKHFAANNQEHRRQSCSSDMAEQTLRELYLPAFENAVKEAKPWTVMCSYNRVNGEYASENKKLLTDILREEWGFDGIVVSDWGAVNDRVKGLAAGLDLEMPASGGITDAQIVAAVKDGALDEAVLDRAVGRILDIIARYTERSHPEAAFDRAAHHALAARLEAECAVLLKNDGILPLNRQSKIAYIGGFAAKPRYQGGGSSHIHSYQITSALSQAAHVTYAPGFPTDRDELDEKLFEEAVKAAKNAEAAVIFAGLPDIFECEGYDRSHMRLPHCQNALIEGILEVQPNTVVVLHCGSPVECPWADRAAAVLCMYLGGEGVGEATDALLYGDKNPGGRLAETWPMKLSDNPSYLNFPGSERSVQYAEGIYVGYRYYDKKQMAVRWPFGHGESYTRFAYSDIRLSQEKMTEGETITVSVDVTNVGSVFGREAVQLYVAADASDRPDRELKGFAKVSLAPGETKTVSLTLDERSLSFYHEALKDWYAPSGRYRLLIGHSSRDIRLEAALTFTAQKHLPLRVTRNTTVGELLNDDRTAPIVRSRLAKIFVTETVDSEVAREAITEEMCRHMVDNAPLRGVFQITEEERIALIEELNEAVGNE